MGLEAFEEGIKIRTGECPLERRGDLLVVILEAKESVFDLRERGEAVRAQRFALDDGEIDLDLVEPAGVNGTMNGNHVGEGRLQAAHAGGATVRGAVVHDPEDAAGGGVGWLAHHVGHQLLEWHDAGGLLATAEELETVNVHGGEIRPGSAAFVLVLNAHGPLRPWRKGGMKAAAGLNAGLLVGGDHEIPTPQGFALPPAAIEVENARRFDGEVWIARKNPAPMLPRANRVLTEPAPDRLVADGGRQSAALHLPGNVAAAHARQGQTARGGQFARHGLNEHDDLRGKKLGGDPSAAALPGPASAARRSVYATGSPRRGQCR